MTNVHDQGPAVLDLGKSLTIAHAARLRLLLLDALDAPAPVVVAWPDDAEADLSFVQLIESTRLLAAIKRRDISTRAPAGGCVLSLLERAGLTTDMAPESRAFWFHERASL
jgi:hypothetical protein